MRLHRAHLGCRARRLFRNARRRNTIAPDVRTCHVATAKGTRIMMTDTLTFDINPIPPSVTFT